jgi:hypothetical protein
MAAASSAASAVAATDASEPFSDCIIASSDRYNDLRPFCDSLYHAEPQKWGRILPWEFPQNANKEVEDSFIRKFFSENEIHMQGGAHGVGAGFRFLKQAWYSIALWNYEQRVPSIANWWLKSEENSSVLADPTMYDSICGPTVEIETFFTSRDVEMYGSTLLGCVVKHIQDQVRARHAEPADKIEATNTVRSTSDSNGSLQTGYTKVVIEASSSGASSDHRNEGHGSHGTPRATSATTSGDAFATPFPIYQERVPTGQRTLNSDVRAVEYPAQQVQGRKRGGRLSSGGSGSGTRSSGYDRRSQEHQQRYATGVFTTNSQFENGLPSFVASTSGPAMHSGPVPVTYSNFPLPMPSGPSAAAFSTAGTRAPVQQSRGQILSSGEHHPHPSHPGMFAGGLVNTSYQFHQQEMQSFAQSGYNEISSRTGDTRRTSFSSRGGSVRASNQYRGARRGGRGAKDSGQQALQFHEEGTNARRASNDPFPKPNSSYGKRRGSVYHENTWRSSSEHPQVENTLPQRVLSGPEPHQSFQDFPGPTPSNMLPFLPFPHDQAVGRQGQADNPPAPTRLSRQQRTLPDIEVDERYIGSDATHITELIVFNIPVQATEDDVARDFSLTCDVKVASVKFDSKANYGPEDSKLAFFKFPNHNVARRVLDLREIQLYGKPLDARVPRKLLSQPAITFVPGQYSHGHNASAGSFVSGNDFTPGPYGYPHGNALGTPFNLPNMAANSKDHPGEMMLRPEIASFSPSVPFYINRGESALPTVLSSNATPATSEPNTPKKSNKKKNNKKKNATPRTRMAEDEVSAQVDAISGKTPQGTPVKIKRKQEELQDRTASSSPLTSRDTPSSGTTPSPEGAREGTQPQLSMNGSISEASQVAAKTEIKPMGEAIQHRQQKSDATPTVSPRSRASKKSSDWSDLPLDNKQCEDSVTSKKSEVLKASSPVSENIRPSILDKPSDSDFVDESFHTASATPPADQKLQDRTPSQRHEKLANDKVHASPAQIDNLSKKNSPSGRPVLPNTVKSMSPERTPKTPLPISVQRLSPPKEKSDSLPKDSKASNLTSCRSVSGLSSTQQAPSSGGTKGDRGKTKEIPHIAIEIVKDRSLVKSAPSTAKQEVSTEETLALNPAAQRAVSTGSIPPTPMATYHTAPTTPAPVPTPMSDHSVSTGGPPSQSKAPAKKGPSQTESFSMFGKKQQKQKKPAKGKGGTLKGKPLDFANVSDYASGTASKDVSGTVTPTRSAGTPSSGKKPALSIKTDTGSGISSLTAGTLKAESKPGDTASNEGTPTAASGQSSPSKGGLRNFFGLFGGRVKSPSVSGKDTSFEDVPPQDELTESKAPATMSQTVFNNERPSEESVDPRGPGNNVGPAARPSTIFDGLEPLDDTSRLSVSGPGISTPSSLDSQEMSKKKKKPRKKKLKVDMQNQDQKDGCSSVDGDMAESVSVSVSSGPTDTSQASYAVESVDGSESSETMGRPTPPQSPILTALTPSRRKLIEQRMTEEHLVSPRAPRNKHVKKKSYSRTASSATLESGQETSLPQDAAASEIEISQQARILQMLSLSNPQHTDGNDDTGSEGAVATPRLMLITGIGENGRQNGPQVNLLYVPSLQHSNDSGRIQIYDPTTHSVSGAGNDDADVAIDVTETEKGG